MTVKFEFIALTALLALGTVAGGAVAGADAARVPIARAPISEVASFGALTPIAAAKIPGEENVQWEENWYSLEDGFQGKLMVRRGSSEKGLWVQFRNDYKQPVSCQATITSTIAGGEPLRRLCYPWVAPGKIETNAPVPGDEIASVEVDKFQFEPFPEGTAPDVPAPKGPKPASPRK